MHRQSTSGAHYFLVTILLVLTISLAEADEAYVIGKRGQYTPVGAYLAGDEIIKIAVEHGAQLIHPGKSACSSSPTRRANSTQVTASSPKTPSLPATSKRLASL
jgi:pyruvate carboxylase